MPEEMSKGTKAKAWLHERIEELSDQRVDEVWEIWQTPQGSEPPTHYADGEPVPEWVFAVREVLLRREKVPSVVALEQTCLLMPSQWEGELDDGRSLYVRYRHGLLRVGVGEGAKDASRNSATESALCCKQIEDADEDMMSFKELRGHLRGVLEFPDELVVELDPDWGTALAL